VAAHAKFRTRLEFSQLPDDWRISNVAVDWNGGPLLLAEEEKPSYDEIATSADARVAWLKTPPTARHLIYWDGPPAKPLRSKIQLVCFQDLCNRLVKAGCCVIVAATVLTFATDWDVPKERLTWGMH